MHLSPALIVLLSLAPLAAPSPPPKDAIRSFLYYSEPAVATSSCPGTLNTIPPWSGQPTKVKEVVNGSLYTAGDGDDQLYSECLARERHEMLGWSLSLSLSLSPPPPPPPSSCPCLWLTLRHGLCAGHSAEGRHSVHPSSFLQAHRRGSRKLPQVSASGYPGPDSRDWSRRSSGCYLPPHQGVSDWFLGCSGGGGRQTGVVKS